LDLLNALAYVEAILDFSEDEQDVGETEVLANVLPKVQAVAASFRAHLADARRGEIVRAGVGIVIAGAPNAGKSTLLNALSRRNVAIVSPVPGTTRDVVENQLNIAGWPCVIADTAGIRKIQATESAAGNAGTEDAALQPQDLAAELSGHDLIEAEGMRRTHERLAASDIKLVLLDASLTVTAAPASTPYDPQVLGMLDERSVLVWTKVDLLPPMQNEATDDASAELAEEIVAPSAAATGRAKLRASQQFYQRTRDAFSPAQLAHFEQLLRSSAAWSLAQQRGARMAFLACSPSASAGSSTNGGGNVGQQRGVQQLLSVLERQIERTVGLDGAAAAAAASSSRVGGPPTAPCSAPSSVPLITRARHRAHVSACLGLLELFESYLERGDLVLAAEQLRLATREIGKITGRVDVEELLDVIFADFCIGK
jgi:tRNA modification GTPase